MTDDIPTTLEASVEPHSRAMESRPSGSAKAPEWRRIPRVLTLLDLVAEDHLSPATIARLMAGEAWTWTAPNDHGWLMYVADEGEDYTAPRDLQACFAQARDLDCNYILFDHEDDTCDASLFNFMPTCFVCRRHRLRGEITVTVAGELVHSGGQWELVEMDRQERYCGAPHAADLRDGQILGCAACGQQYYFLDGAFRVWPPE